MLAIFFLPGDGEVDLNLRQQVFILLLQNLDSLLQEHVLLGLLKSATQPQRNVLFTMYYYHVSACVRVCVCVRVGTAYLSLPLSPDQRSSSLAGVSVGSSSPRPPSSSSGLSRCAGMEPKLPVTVTDKTNRKADSSLKAESSSRSGCF